MKKPIRIFWREKVFFILLKWFLHCGENCSKLGLFAIAKNNCCFLKRTSLASRPYNRLYVFVVFFKPWFPNVNKFTISKKQ